MAYTDYGKRLGNLKSRRQDVEIIKKAFATDYYKRLDEAYEKLSEGDSIRYVIGAMLPVDKTYTDNTYQEGDRVKNQLSKGLSLSYSIEFRYQGSVTNYTHIKAHSDIDLLTIHGGFISLEPPLKPSSPYQGNPIEDLINLRADSYKLLREAFPTAKVDNTGAKCISLSGGSLRRKIDVVPSNWYDTVKYEETKDETYRGVNILDLPNKQRIKNTPFYHNMLLNNKDSATSGNYKKMVRLLKTLKVDSEKDIKLSSYDIAGLMYHMDNTKLLVGSSPLLLINNSIQYLNSLYSNDVVRNMLRVPDGSRTIFQTDGATKNDLKLILNELEGIFRDILDELNQKGSKIDKQILVS